MTNNTITNDTFLQYINDKIDTEQLLIDLKIIEEFDIGSHLNGATCFGYDLDIEIKNAKSDYKHKIKPVVDKALNILIENGLSGKEIKSAEAKQLLLNNM